MSWLRVQLGKMWLRPDSLPCDQYISILWKGVFHFSKTYNRSHIGSFSFDLAQTILLPIDNEDPPLFLLMQLWQNHMILYEHTLDMLELKSRPATRRQLEIRQGDILQFWVSILRQDEISIGSQPISIPHFILVQNISTTVGALPDKGPSYFAIESEGEKTIVPILDAVSVISLPSKFKFQHYKNGYLYSQSSYMNWQQLKQDHINITMITKLDIEYEIRAIIKWVTLTGTPKIIANALFDAVDILLYDIQIKLQPKQGIREGLKLKVTAGHKGYELGGELELGKTIKIARLLYFIVKSEGQDFFFVLQRKSRVVAKVAVGPDELVSYKCNIFKKQIVEPISGKLVGTIKFKGEKGRGISPHSNALWRNNTQKKQHIILDISQLSLLNASCPCKILLRTEDEEHLIDQIPDFSVFSLQTILPPPLEVQLVKNGTVYLKLVPETDGDLEGMAVIDPKQLRFGVAPLKLKFFKQQVLVCEGRCLVNKVFPWQISRSSIESQLHTISAGLAGQMGLSIILRGVQLTSMYWSYLYDGKGDFYCIIEINRVKKVLVLEKGISSERLFFLPATSSDVLNFMIDKSETVCVKITILATDTGVEEQIYGTLSRRIKFSDILQENMSVNGQKIINQYNLVVGKLDFDLQTGLLGEYKKPIKNDLNQIKGDLEKINRSIQKVEMHQRSPQMRKKMPRQVSKSLVLPQIKDAKQERLVRLARALQQKAKPKKRLTVELNENRASTESPKLPLLEANPRMTEQFPELGRRETPINLQMNEMEENQFLNENLMGMHEEENQFRS